MSGLHDFREELYDKTCSKAQNGMKVFETEKKLAPQVSQDHIKKCYEAGRNSLKNQAISQSVAQSG